MSKLNSKEIEVAQLIVDGLNLEDIAVNDIEPDMPLFREGLGLDSIDALELSLVISQRYGVQLRSDDPNNTHIFSSLRSLSQYIESNLNKA